MSDFGRNDRVVSVKTHLGNLLHPGDRALGYDTGNANLVDQDFERAMEKGLDLPDVILVRTTLLFDWHVLGLTSIIL